MFPSAFPAQPSIDFGFTSALPGVGAQPVPRFPPFTFELDQGRTVQPGSEDTIAWVSRYEIRLDDGRSIQGILYGHTP